MVPTGVAVKERDVGNKTVKYKDTIQLIILHKFA